MVKLRVMEIAQFDQISVRTATSPNYGSDEGLNVTLNIHFSLNLAREINI